MAAFKVRKGRSVKSPNRSASEALHVMLEPADMSRYRQLAAELGDLSMRELVQRGLERLWTQHEETKRSIPSRLLGGEDVVFGGPTISFPPKPGDPMPVHPGGPFDHVPTKDAKVQHQLHTQDVRLGRLEQVQHSFNEGLLTYLVMNRAHEVSRILGDGSDDDWKKKGYAYVDASFQDVMDSFPSPLRETLLQDKDAFVRKAFLKSK